MNKMRVLFCDIDGVLNFAEYGDDTYYDKYYGKEVALDDECIKHLKRLLHHYSLRKCKFKTR